MPTTAKRIDARIRYEPESQLYRLSFGALGTNCSVLFAAKSDDRAAAFARTAVQWVADFETKYSRFLPDSLISEINRQAGKRAVAIDEETHRLFEVCDSAHQSSHGLLDATALPLLRLWDYRAKPVRVPTPSEIEATLELVGWPMVQRDRKSVFLPKEGMQLDLGGIGKEYAVDRVAELAHSHGIANALIDFGGDIRAEGTPPNFDVWSIGIENPMATDITDETILLSEGAVASSGNYRRNFVIEGRVYGHIVDPRTGRPSAPSAQIATVIADTCLKAGMLATSACLLPLADAISEIEHSFPAEGRVFQENRTATTRGFYEYVLKK